MCECLCVCVFTEPMITLIGLIYLYCNIFNLIPNHNVDECCCLCLFDKGVGVGAHLNQPWFHPNWREINQFFWCLPFVSPTLKRKKERTIRVRSIRFYMRYPASLSLACLNADLMMKALKLMKRRKKSRKNESRWIKSELNKMRSYVREAYSHCSGAKKQF